MSTEVLPIRIRIRKQDLTDRKIDIGKLQRRVDRLVAAIQRAAIPILQEFGDQILAMARYNVATYYEKGGAAYSGNRPQPFKPRHPATEELYAKSPYHEATGGLSAGYDVIIESLFPNGFKNIFNIDPGEPSVEVGTSGWISKLMEEGGLRPPLRHVGQGEKRQYLPWQDILAKYGIDPAGPIEIPPRPFLKPALWHLRDEDDGKFLYGLMIEIMKRMIEQIPGIEVEAA